MPTASTVAGRSKRFELSCELDAPPDVVWQHVQTTQLLDYVAAPMVRFEPVRPSVLPREWIDGVYEVRMRLWGWLPAGRHTIRITRRLDGEVRSLRDNGGGDLAKVWNHHIQVEPAPGGKTRYTDSLEVRAGTLTPLVWLFARLFYRHRQRRWRALVKSGFDYGSRR